MEKRKSSYTVGMSIDKPTTKNSMEVPQKTIGKIMI